MKNSISCLIFDFDGVIADTDLGRYKILVKLLKKYNNELTISFSKEELIGLSTKSFLKKYFKNMSEKEIDKIIKKRHEIFFSNLKNYCIPYKNMVETISDLSSKYDLAIATTSNLENVKTQLKYLGIIDYFKWIMGREITENSNLEKTYKPVSTIIEKKIKECIVIEDSDFGIQAAKKEGYYCIKFEPALISKNTLENEKVSSYSELKSRLS